MNKKQYDDLILYLRFRERLKAKGLILTWGTMFVLTAFLLVNLTSGLGYFLMGVGMVIIGVFIISLPYFFKKERNTFPELIKYIEKRGDLCGKKRGK